MGQPRNIIEPLRPYGKIILIVLTLALLLVLFLFMRSCLRSRLTGPEVVGGFPEIRNKPQPVNRPFEGCPPEGDGGDPVLNRLKNRVDDGNYVPVQFEAIAQLQWPKAVERKHHDRWSDSDAAAVARYEGTPVSVEGYLADAREEGPESPNCHGADHEFRDFHIWLTKSAGDDRSNSIVVEITPPVRVNHPNWRVNVLKRIARDEQRVRISGWIMLDPEHPDQVGKTRGTIWEVHPVMELSIRNGQKWVPLDDLK